MDDRNKMQLRGGDEPKGKSISKTKFEAPSGKVIGEQRNAVSKAAEKNKLRPNQENEKQQRKNEKRARVFAAGVIGASLVGLGKAIKDKQDN
jgi:hypothetical protein